MLTGVTSAYSLLKIVSVDVILFLQGRSKEIRYTTVPGQYALEVNFGNVNTALTRRNLYRPLRSTPVCCSPLENCYTFLQGRTKEIRHITFNGRYWLEVNFSNVVISLRWLNFDMLLRSTPSTFCIKNGVCSCYTFLQGRIKKPYYIKR